MPQTTIDSMIAAKGKSTTQPLVTIITPAYNRVQYLQETIESILLQDYPKVEYIVLDDGSKDNTVELLETYTGKLIWESHENMGEIRTVNKAYGMAKGEYIAVINSDDPLLPGAISAAVDVFLKNPDVQVVYPDWSYIDSEGKTIMDMQTPEYDYLEMLATHRCMPGPGTFVSKRALDLVGLRDPHFKYISDFDLWLRIGLRGPFKRLPQVLATYRVHPTSLSSTEQGRKMASEDIEMLDRLYSRNDLPMPVRAIKKKAYSWGHYHACQVAGSAKYTAALHALMAILYCPSAFRGPEFLYKRQIVKRAFNNILPSFLKISPAKGS
ncbi:MAG: glycosyltransferase [Candidatus Melainabacteria bacterium]|nr:glycosyltransferase [Candidatus Melainabacteria bacterium]